MWALVMFPAAEVRAVEHSCKERKGNNQRRVLETVHRPCLPSMAPPMGGLREDHPGLQPPLPAPGAGEPAHQHVDKCSELELTHRAPKLTPK